MNSVSKNCNFRSIYDEIMSSPKMCVAINWFTLPVALKQVKTALDVNSEWGIPYVPKQEGIPAAACSCFGCNIDRLGMLSLIADRERSSLAFNKNFSISINPVF